MEFTVANLVKWFQLKHSKIVKAMIESNHHYDAEFLLNPYHLEGDVWTHTMMVVLEASKLKKKLDGNMYNHVLVSALLHDIGKPLARKVSKEKKRVHFWGHEPISAFLCISILKDIEKEFNIKLNHRLIIEAIAMHTDVYNVPREKLADRLIKNQPLADLLSYLSSADYAGRFFEMGERDMEHIEVKPSSGLYAPKETKEVVCMIGLPCSGKSTVLKDMKEQHEGYVVLSRDDIVMELGRRTSFNLSYNEAFKLVDQKEVDKMFQGRRSTYIKLGLNVIIDMTNMGRKARRRNMQGFKDYYKTAHVCMTDLATIRHRNEHRAGKVLPQRVFENMTNSFQPPLYDEFDHIDWTIT
jgi:putative nucleotidyltransferase with HDIG domain